MKKTIVIDFDGVIHRYSKGWQGGEIYDPPYPEAFQAIGALLKSYTVVICSTRDPQDIYNWLIEQSPIFEFSVMPDSSTFWNVENVVGITNRKIPAIAYIDDRAIRFTNWTDLMNYF